MTDKSCATNNHAISVRHMTDNLLTTHEAAAALGISAVTVTWRARNGRLTPALKLPGDNGPYLFDRAEIERLASEQVTA